MTYTWYDVVIGLVLVGVIIFESRQNFGRSMLDAVAAVVALFLASACTGPVASFCSLTRDPAANLALINLALFCLFMAAGIQASRLGHHLWLYFSADPFDWFFGGAYGIVIAIILGHTFTSSLRGYYGHATPTYLVRSQAAQELMDLHTIRGAVDACLHAGTGHG